MLLIDWHRPSYTPGPPRDSLLPEAQLARRMTELFHAFYDQYLGRRWFTSAVAIQEVLGAWPRFVATNLQALPPADCEVLRLVPCSRGGYEIVACTRDAGFDDPSTHYLARVREQTTVVDSGQEPPPEGALS